MLSLCLLTMRIFFIYRMLIMWWSNFLSVSLNWWCIISITCSNMAYRNFVVCMSVEVNGFIVLHCVYYLHTCSVLPVGGDMGDFTKRSEVRTGGMGKLQKMMRQTWPVNPFPCKGHFENCPAWILLPLSKQQTCVPHLLYVDRFASQATVLLYGQLLII